jgi:hypothetical protein
VKKWHKRKKNTAAGDLWNVVAGKRIASYVDFTKN